MSDLKQYLASPQRPAGTMNYLELQGFLLTIACSPELITPPSWLPIVIDDNDNTEDITEAAANALIGELFKLYNKINQQVLDRQVQLPTDCVLAGNPVDNIGDDAPLGQWSQGFIRGQNWLSEIWAAHVPDELDTELGSCIMVLSAFSSRNIAETFINKLGNSSKTIDEVATSFLDLFEHSMRRYALLGLSFRQSSQEVDTPSNVPVVNTVFKTGRNALCSCGSGKKYKQCCLH